MTTQRYARLTDEAVMREAARLVARVRKGGMLSRRVAWSSLGVGLAVAGLASIGSFYAPDVVLFNHTRRTVVVSAKGREYPMKPFGHVRLNATVMRPIFSVRCDSSVTWRYRLRLPPRDEWESAKMGGLLGGEFYFTVFGDGSRLDPLPKENGFPRKGQRIIGDWMVPRGFPLRPQPQL